MSSSPRPTCVVVMVGPASVIRATLADSRPGATVAWIVKNDPAALLPDVVAALRRRADIIFHNAAESSVVEGMPAESKTIVVRTDGPRPVTVTTSGANRTYPIAPCATVAQPDRCRRRLRRWLSGGVARRSADEASCVAAGAAAARRTVGGDTVTAWYLKVDASPAAAVLVGDRGRVLMAAEMLDDARLVNEERGLTTVVGSVERCRSDRLARSGWARRSPPS